MELKQLAECPEHFETVSNWIYEQWWQAHHKTPEVLLKRLRPHLEINAFPYTVVAIIEGEPVGSCCVVRNDCEHRPQYSPWVAAVYVRPENRLQGVASRILRKAFHIAKTHRIKGLYIDCWAKTAPLYEKNGWDVFERDVGQKDSLVMYRGTGCDDSSPKGDASPSRR